MLQDRLPYDVFVPVEDLDFEFLYESTILVLNLLELAFSDAHAVHVGEAFVQELRPLQKHDRVVSNYSLCSQTQCQIVPCIHRVSNGVLYFVR